jgi:hypothetical protein
MGAEETINRVSGWHDAFEDEDDDEDEDEARYEGGPSCWRFPGVETPGLVLTSLRDTSPYRSANAPNFWHKETNSSCPWSPWTNRFGIPANPT